VAAAAPDKKKLRENFPKQGHPQSVQKFGSPKSQWLQGEGGKEKGLKRKRHGTRVPKKKTSALRAVNTRENREKKNNEKRGVLRTLRE